MNCSRGDSPGPLECPRRVSGQRRLRSPRRTTLAKTESAVVEPQSEALKPVPSVPCAAPSPFGRLERYQRHQSEQFGHSGMRRHLHAWSDAM